MKILWKFCVGIVEVLLTWLEDFCVGICGSFAEVLWNMLRNMLWKFCGSFVEVLWKLCGISIS